MASIYLIRHGQASFGKADYDQLSEKGAEQAKILGKYWQSMPAPTQIYAGDLLRHGQTLDNFLLGYQGKKPSTILHSGFNEFNHVDILSCYDEKWQDFAKMAALISQKSYSNKTFQKDFAQALNRWVSSTFDDEYKESWGQFKRRCISALQDVMNQARGAKKNAPKSNHSDEICIFTSGGTISAIVQEVMGLSDEKILLVNQQIRNTSVTKLLFSDNKVNIDYLNNFNHLTIAGNDWVTFR